MSSNINFTIYSHIGTIGLTKRMTHKDLNVVGWGRYSPNFDLRCWSSDNTIDSKGKGITLTLEELRELKKILNEIDLDSEEPIIFMGQRLDDNDSLNSVREEVSTRRAMIEQSIQSQQPQPQSQSQLQSPQPQLQSPQPQPQSPQPILPW